MGKIASISLCHVGSTDCEVSWHARLVEGGTDVLTLSIWPIVSTVWHVKNSDQFTRVLLGSPGSVARVREVLVLYLRLLPDQPQRGGNLATRHRGAEEHQKQQEGRQRRCHSFWG